MANFKRKPNGAEGCLGEGELGCWEAETRVKLAEVEECSALRTGRGEDF